MAACCISAPHVRAWRKAEAPLPGVHLLPLQTHPPEPPWTHPPEPPWTHPPEPPCLPHYHPLPQTRSILPGQRKRMLQDERHTTAMLRFAGLKPRERLGYLHGGQGCWRSVVARRGLELAAGERPSGGAAFAPMAQADMRRC